MIVSLEASAFYIDESEGFVEVCAEADHQFETSFEVRIQTANSEAIGKSLTLTSTYSRMYSAAGEDYVAVDKYILFSPERSLIECVHIPVLNDECVEDKECFYVSLSPTDECVEIGENDTARVTIIDDDSKLWLCI